MMLHTVMVTQCADRALHMLVAGSIILLVGGSVNNSLSSIIFMKNAYFEELLEMCILYSFNVDCYARTVIFFYCFCFASLQSTSLQSIK
jgi:hypothetical protein